MNMLLRRLPLIHLLRGHGIRHERPNRQATDPELAPYNLIATSRRWGCHLHRELDNGGLTVAMAERICDQLGTHPATVWGDAYYDACEVRYEVPTDTPPSGQGHPPPHPHREPLSVARKGGPGTPQ